MEASTSKARSKSHLKSAVPWIPLAGLPAPSASGRFLTRSGLSGGRQVQNLPLGIFLEGTAPPMTFKLMGKEITAASYPTSSRATVVRVLKTSGPTPHYVVHLLAEASPGSHVRVGQVRQFETWEAVVSAFPGLRGRDPEADPTSFMF